LQLQVTFCVATMVIVCENI